MKPDVDLVVAFFVSVGFALLFILILKISGQLMSVRKKLLNAELQNMVLARENDSLRRQVEKDRNEDRAKRGDYGTVYEGSYKEVYQSKKTGQWFASRIVTVDP